MLLSQVLLGLGMGVIFVLSFDDTVKEAMYVFKNIYNEKRLTRFMTNDFSITVNTCLVLIRLWPTFQGSIRQVMLSETF